MATKSIPKRVIGLTKDIKQWIESTKTAISNIVSNLKSLASSVDTKPTVGFPDYAEGTVLVSGTIFELKGGAGSIAEWIDSESVIKMLKPGWLLIDGSEYTSVQLGSLQWFNVTNPTIEAGHNREYGMRTSAGIVPAMVYAPTRDTVASAAKVYYKKEEESFVRYDIAPGATISSSDNLHEYVRLGSELTVGITFTGSFVYRDDTEFRATMYNVLVAPQHYLRSYSTYPAYGMFPVNAGTILQIPGMGEEGTTVTFFPFAP